MNSVKEWLKNLGLVYKVLIVFAFVFGAYHGLLVFIDWRIETKIRQENFVKEIADDLRPFVIFDEEGKILYDEGGMNYVKNIQVLPGKDGVEPEKIVISPLKPLRRDPILHSLNYSFQIAHSKGKPFDHIFELGSPTLLRLEGDGRSIQITSWQFKLEILH